MNFSRSNGFSNRLSEWKYWLWCLCRATRTFCCEWKRGRCGIQTQKVALWPKKERMKLEKINFFQESTLFLLKKFISFKSRLFFCCRLFKMWFFFNFRLVRDSWKQSSSATLLLIQIRKFNVTNNFCGISTGLHSYRSTTKIRCHRSRLLKST